MALISELISKFGYIVLYLSLTLELIALPLPGETLMTYCGFLIYEGNLNFVLCIIFSTAGIITGITISYFLGRRLGDSIFHKYGSKIHMGPEKLDKASVWFNKYGNKLLIISYFIPGLRHITGYFAGITKIDFRRFALNAYIGALIWASTFISLGEILGANWEEFHGYMTKYLIIGSIILTIILLCIYFVKNHKEQIINITNKLLSYWLKIFHSLRKVKLVVIGIAVLLIGLLVVCVGLIQYVLVHEFTTFDVIVDYIIKESFSDNWAIIFDKVYYLTTYQSLIVITIILIGLVIIKGRNKFLEIKFIFLTLWGGEFLGQKLRSLFQEVGPVIQKLNTDNIYTFPSQQALMVIVAYGFVAFFIIRYLNKLLIASIAISSVLVICIFVGLGPLFFQYQYASDIIAGYVFGGAWLILNIALLEIFRILLNINIKKVS